MTNRQDAMFLMEAIIDRLIDTHVLGEDRFFTTLFDSEIYVEKKLLSEHMDITEQRLLESGYISITFENYTLNHHSKDLQIEINIDKPVVEFSFTDECIIQDLQTLFNKIYSMGQENPVIIFKGNKKYKVVEIE